MNDLEIEIQRLEQAKEDLKTQIQSKGGTVGAGTIDTYDVAVQSIPSAYAPKYICFYMYDGTEQEFAADIAGIDTSQAKHIYGIAWDLNKTASMYTPVPQSVTINWNTPALVDTSDMFSTPDRRSYSTVYLNELHQITITHLDTRHVTNMKGMFRGCRYVTDLDLRALQFGTSTIEMYSMFNGCTALQNIQFSSSEMAKPSGLEFFCANCQSLETINIDTWDFTNVTNMQSAFSGCKKLQSLPNGANLFTNSCENYSNTFDGCKLITSVNSTGSIHNTPVKNMGSMFSECTSLTTAILPGFTAAGNCYFSGMFSGCTALTTVDLSNWDTSSAQAFGDMFKNCSSLTSLDLRSFTVRVGGNFSSVRSMFLGCTSLMHLDLRSFRFDRIPSAAYPLQMFGNSSGAVTIPTNCEIIVEDATQKTWMNNNYPTLTNVLTVAEYEAQ